MADEKDARQVLVEVLDEVLGGTDVARRFPGTTEELSEKLVTVLDDYLDLRGQDYALKGHGHMTLQRIG